MLPAPLGVKTRGAAGAAAALSSVGATVSAGDVATPVESAGVSWSVATNPYIGEETTREGRPSGAVPGTTRSVRAPSVLETGAPVTCSAVSARLPTTER